MTRQQSITNTVWAIPESDQGRGRQVARFDEKLYPGDRCLNVLFNVEEMAHLPWTHAVRQFRNELRRIQLHERWPRALAVADELSQRREFRFGARTVPRCGQN